MVLRVLIVSLLCSVSLARGQVVSDTARLHRQLELAGKQLDRNTDSAQALLLKLVRESTRINAPYSRSQALALLAHCHFLKGHNDSALLVMQPAIRFAHLSNDTIQLILTHLQEARLYALTGQYAKAMADLQVAEHFGELKYNPTCAIRMAHDHAFIYSNMGLHEKAIGYFRTAFELAREQRDTFHMANNAARMGGEFNDLGQFDSALHYNTAGLELFQRLQHKRGIGATLTNLNTSYGGLKNYRAQMAVIRKALKLRTELGDRYALVMLRNLQANCYLQMKQYGAALQTAASVEVESAGQSRREILLENYRVQYLALQQLKRERDALVYADKYIRLKDALFNTKQLTGISELQARYETDKHQKEIRLLQLEKQANQERQAAQDNKRNLILTLVLSIALLSSVFATLFYRRVQKTRQQNLVIEGQKQLVDEKNAEIIDSITYARTIQQALTPAEDELRGAFADAFVIARPKSIVSGDFYWYTCHNGFHFVAIADCTGHGVPGAFMSLLGMSFLNELVSSQQQPEPAALLNELRNKVVASLNKESGSHGKQDGMDMVLLRFDLQHHLLDFSGANNSIYIASGSELLELRGDKMPVGLYYGKTTSFTNHRVKLQPGDRIFAFTDGLPDQFGGPGNKKFMYRRVEQVFTDFRKAPLHELKTALEQRLAEWQGHHEQIDDITCLGIEIAC